MKKLILFVAVTLFAFNVNAQDGDDSGSNGQEGFRLGANLGTTVGDFSDWYGLAINFDVDYDFSVSDQINLGVSSGFTSYLGKDDNDYCFNYVPLAGSIDFNLSDQFSIGGDAGVAIGIEENSGSDFLYRFQLRYQASDQVDISGRYNSISGNGATISNVSLGVGFRF